MDRNFAARCALAMFSLCFATQVRAGRLDIYVLAGQSNMSGWGQVDELVHWGGGVGQSQTDVLYHTKGAGFGYLRPTDDDFGPELSFGRTMADGATTAIAIVKEALGSTSLAEDWNPDQDAGMYQRLLARVEKARTYWSAEGYDVRVAGIVWMQGEEDAKEIAMASLYEQNLVEFIDRVRQDLGALDTPFVYGEIRGKDFPYRDVVRSAQRAVDVLGIGAYLVDTDDLSTYEELHFDTLSQLTLGRRFATVMLGARSNVFGDTTGDGIVELADVNAVRNNFGNWGEGDATLDGRIDLDDLNAVRNSLRSGSSRALPEPSSIGLCVVAVFLYAITILARRKEFVGFSMTQRSATA